MPANQLKPKVSAKRPSSAKTTFLADTVVARETDEFARSLLKRLRETQTLSSSPAKLEIKVGREISYRGTEGQVPEVNKLSPAAIAYLAAAIKVPQAGSKQQGKTDKALNRAVTIKVDNEVVFRLNKGVVETNKLQPELAQQISQAVSINIQSPLEVVQTQSQAQGSRQEQNAEPTQPQTVSEPVESQEGANSSPASDLPPHKQEVTDGIVALDETQATQGSSDAVVPIPQEHLEVEQLGSTGASSPQQLNSYYRYMDHENVMDLADIDARYDPAEIDSTDFEQEPASTSRCEHIVKIADRLLQSASGEENSLDHQKQSFGEYTIQKEGEVLTISRGEQAILTAQNGQIENLDATVADQHAFMTIEDFSLDALPESSIQNLIVEKPLPQTEVVQAAAFESSSQSKGQEIIGDSATLSSEQAKPHSEQTITQTVASTPSQPQASHGKEGADIKTKETHTPTTPAEPALPQSQSMPGKENLQSPESPPDAAPTKTVPALDLVERQVQKQPEGSVRQYLGQAVQALKAASQLAGAKVQQRAKSLPTQAHAVVANTQQQLKQLPQQVVKIPEVVRDRQIANTALQLLEKYGTRTEQCLTYQAADYTIQATGKNTYAVSDKQGKSLMRFKQNFFGPQIISSGMSRRQHQDFARAGSQIQIQGGTPFLPADPAMRVRQLQGLAPAADVALAQEAKNIAAVTSVQNVLKTLGRDRYQNDKYRFQQRGNSLTITAKDGRNDILTLKNGEIQASLKPVDISYFRQLDQQVTKELAPQSAQSPLAKQSELVQ